MKQKTRQHGCNHGIFFISDHGPHKNQVDKGDLVVLITHAGDDALHVIVTETTAAGRYRGRVERFDFSPYDTVDGVSLGDPIEFEDHHIFACHSD